MSTQETRLRRATENDLATILRWRNHPEVRRVMFTDHEITEAEHLAWWSRVHDDPAYRLLLIEHRDTPCGVVTFSRMDVAAATWLWGFYLDPEGFADGLERLRAWNGMELASLAWARSELECVELRCEVFAFNTAVLQMHLRHRFIETGRYMRQRGSESLEVIQLSRKP
ncbi:hypothetical protein GCM10025771_28950 [Niveibacterium umoris]|uniref:UDP-4-amino-4, 6-dideoxy-N-acetyl-beta-L-altrosamine N-acetyltransferase n=1 Tax=Niveibacterium umoris TaxID=1193620 RepID=A0A840BJX4_9RHOO|nr:UDP-4-amino-4,6-dideoxy-N-acetyl-beta-L-altrosamine N-acetyltransferase [Niveibacterium umoris]MBB4011912.1 UDP-4-amino-4,6-dideoxy-N-acetyl-beta-L-altrosamine N-acetyltransferase [Niveibacterium umoris]